MAKSAVSACLSVLDTESSERHKMAAPISDSLVHLLKM